jgi:hypothetical protein
MKGVGPLAAAAVVGIGVAAGVVVADWNHDNDCVLVWGRSATSRVTCASLGAADQGTCETACAQHARRLDATADCVREASDGSRCPGEGGLASFARGEAARW